jgi:two-component system C4-dicarboxylate transport sensor histidine kinase DctB
MAESVDTCLAIFRQRFITRGIAVERHYEPGVAVSIAPYELRQVVTNLISNAADAITNDTPRIDLHIFAEGLTAVLLVEDNGSGISDEAAARIFEPFFTTKQDVGTGIGLWVTRELIENNGGHISVVSGSLPHGMRTRFRIELPLAPTTQNLDPPSLEHPAYVP